MIAFPERILVVLAGTAGGTGVALAAAAAHLAAGATLETSARFLLVHAPAFLGLAALLGGGFLHRRLGLVAGAVLALGCLLFSGDLAWRALVGTSLVPLAAPTGGILLIAGWALLVPAALIGNLPSHQA